MKILHSILGGTLILILASCGGSSDNPQLAAVEEIVEAYEDAISGDTLCLSDINELNMTIARASQDLNKLDQTTLSAADVNKYTDLMSRLAEAGMKLMTKSAAADMNC